MLSEFMNENTLKEIVELIINSYIRSIQNIEIAEEEFDLEDNI